ncbi:hypothetical protein [Taklimakanibacter deserti]
MTAVLPRSFPSKNLMQSGNFAIFCRAVKNTVKAGTRTFAGINKFDVA